MGAVDLDDLEAGVERTAGGGGEVGHGPGDLIPGHGAWRRKSIEGDVARSDWLPATVSRDDRSTAAPWSERRSLPPGVSELDASGRALLPDERRDRAEGIALTVVPEAEVVGRDPALRTDGGRFDDDHPDPADGPRAKVNEVPFSRGAGVRTV